MRTSYKYIRFEDRGTNLRLWKCLNKSANTILGYATFYEPWYQWVMELLNKGKQHEPMGQTER